MAPMIGASIIAMQHDLDPPLVTLMVGIGIPLSFFTLPACWYVLRACEAKVEVKTDIKVSLEV